MALLQQHRSTSVASTSSVRTITVCARMLTTTARRCRSKVFEKSASSDENSASKPIWCLYPGVVPMQLLHLLLLLCSFAAGNISAEYLVGMGRFQLHNYDQLLFGQYDCSRERFNNTHPPSSAYEKPDQDKNAICWSVRVGKSDITGPVADVNLMVRR